MVDACGGFPLQWPSVGSKEVNDVMNDDTAALLTNIVTGYFPNTTMVTNLFSDHLLY